MCVVKAISHTELETLSPNESHSVICIADIRGDIARYQHPKLVTKHNFIFGDVLPNQTDAVPAFEAKTAKILWYVYGYIADLGVNTLYIQCRHGQSRSKAVVAALTNTPSDCPNIPSARYIYRLLRDVIEAEK